MATRYRIYPDLGYVHTVYEGAVTLLDMIGQFHRLNADPKFVRGMDTIVDFTAATTVMKFDDAFTFADHLKQVHQSRGPCRWAIVVPEDFQFGIANMFLMFFDGISIDVKPFRNVDDAREWLMRKREKS